MLNVSPSWPEMLIGCGAGFSGDRVDAPQAVVDHLIADGRPSALILETLGERTLALAQKAKLNDAESGFEPLLDQILTPILEKCINAGIPIIGNFGAANPRGAAQRIMQILGGDNASPIRIAIVEGDDLRADLHDSPLSPWDGTPQDYVLPKDNVVAANAYLGAIPIAEALAQGAQIVVTGRVADPALALGPLINGLGWSVEDWDLIAAGTMAGHLLECGSQITGGYFADPGIKDVPDPARIGFPIAEVSQKGEVILTKAANTGGRVDVRTGREQLLYEVHDPSAYITPDVIADISEAEISQVGENRIALTGVRGRPAPDSLKVTISLNGGWLGEGEISYAGPNAVARGKMAIEILQERLKIRGLDLRTRLDLIGTTSVFDSDSGALRQSRDGTAAYETQDVRVRLAVEAPDRSTVEAATQEVLAMLCCGPAGGGGMRRNHVQRINTVSYLVPKSSVQPRVSFL